MVGPSGANRNAKGGAGALNPYSVVVNNSQEGYENRLVNLESFISTGTANDDDALNEAFSAITGPAAKFNYNPKATSENPDTPILYSYAGGPGSILGIGKTNIFKHRPTYNAIRNYQNLALIFSKI